MRTTRRRFLVLTASATVSALAAPRLLRTGATAAHAQAIPGSPTFKGAAGNTALGPVTLNAGLTIVRAQFNGTANFISSMIMPTPGSGPNDANPVSGGFFSLFDQIGAFKGAASALVGVPGDWYFTVDSTAAYQISIEQPLPELVTPVQQTSFTGKGTDVTPYFMLPDGISTITLQTDNPNAEAYLYHLDDLGGEAIVAGVQGFQSTLFDFRDPTNQPTFPLTLPDDGPYVFAVTNDIYDTFTWTVSFA